MALALFDLDNTLLGGDSDYLWGRFLVEQGIVDGESYERENRAYYEQYKAGTLNIQEFLAFSLRPLAQHPTERLHAWRDEFIARLIDPIILPDARALVERHRAQGDTPVIITATNRFVTAPIAARFGIEHLIATEVEMDGARYTGRSTDIPCFQGGKVQRLRQWLEATAGRSHRQLVLQRLAQRPAVTGTGRASGRCRSGRYPGPACAHARLADHEPASELVRAQN